MKNVHFVLVHDAGQGASVWHKLVNLLERAGHRVTALDMAASGMNESLLSEVKTFSEYSKPLLDFMQDKVPAGEKVVLVGHGLGGMNVALAMDTYPNKVKVGVFVNAFMPDTKNRPSYVIDEYMRRFGYSIFMDSIIEWDNGTDKPLTSITFGLEYMKTKLYQLTPDEDLILGRTLQRATQFFQEDLQKQPAFSLERYGSVPRVAINGKENLVMVEWFQNFQVQNFPLKESQKVLQTTPHLVMLSNPKAFCSSLLEIAKKYH